MQPSDNKLLLVENHTLGPTTFPKRHVFLDIDNLTQWGSGIYQRFPQPEVLPTYGLECGSPDSWDARLATDYGTVLFEDGLYRQWGSCMPGIKDLGENPDTPLSSYAESEDGIHWVKPKLNAIGTKFWPNNNLINVEGFLLSVVRPLPSAGWKYVALSVKGAPPLPGIYSDKDEGYLGKNYREFTEGGTYLYGSDDGTQWSQITRKPIVRHGDVAWLHVDPIRQRYLLYQKLGANHGLTSRRSFIVMESKDLIHWEGYQGYRQWNEMAVGDDYDDLRCMQHGFKTGEFNGLAFHQIDSLYLSVQAFFMTKLPLVQYSGQNPSGGMVLRLAYSHNGMNWRYPQGRPIFVDNSPPGEFGASYFASTSNILDVGDDTLHYFTAYKRCHGYGIDINFRLNKNIPPEAQNESANFLVAKMKRDRYASLASTYKDSFDCEIGPRQGNELSFNGITRGGGTIRFAIAEQSYPLHLEPRKSDSLPGFSFDDCIPFSGDEVRAPIHFKKKSVAEIPDNMALILRFELDGAEVFGFEWHSGGDHV